MTQSNISIRIDNNLKQQFDKFCDELGLSMSAAINLFIKTTVREQRIPLDLSLHIPNEKVRQAIENAQKGIGLSKVYDSVDEMMKDLLSDDEDDEI